MRTVKEIINKIDNIKEDISTLDKIITDYHRGEDCILNAKRVEALNNAIKCLNSVVQKYQNYEVIESDKE